MPGHIFEQVSASRAKSWDVAFELNGKKPPSQLRTQTVFR